MGKTDKGKSIIGSQVCGGNKRNDSTEKVPTGLFYWFSEGDIKHPVHLLMDQHGELFLIQKGKGVYWSYKTNTEMYSLLVSEGVHNYVDAGEDMFPYSHTRGLKPKVISHGSLEDLREKLIRTYGDEIQATSKVFKLDLNYQNGEKLGVESTTQRFPITITRYEIVLSSLARPPTLRSRLVFAKVKAVFPNTNFSCKVLYARNLAEFMKVCQNFDIERLPGGRTIHDLLWIQE